MICPLCKRDDVLLWSDGELRCNYCFNRLKTSFKVNIEGAREHRRGICPFCGENNQPFSLDWENDRLVCVKCRQSFRPLGLEVDYWEVYDNQKVGELFMQLFFNDQWWLPLDLHRTRKKITVLVWILDHLA
jgi:hypothetical protein